MHIGIEGGSDRFDDLRASPVGISISAQPLSSDNDLTTSGSSSDNGHGTISGAMFHFGGARPLPAFLALHNAANVFRTAVKITNVSIREGADEWKWLSDELIQSGERNVLISRP